MMDCCICSAMPYNLRPPRNTICCACYEEATSIIAFTSRHDPEKGPHQNKAGNSSAPSNKGLKNVMKWVKRMKEMEDELNEKMRYLSGIASAYTDQIHTDIQLKSGDGGSTGIRAHRALLASRSDVFRNILDSDGCKAPPADTVTLPEMSHEELECLLEFLYSGHLDEEKVEKHVYSLSIAADKYEIPFLQRFCENHMLRSLSSSNALDILEISDTCSHQMLKETALNFVVKNMEDVVFTEKFDAFALKNPHLTVQITRASLMDIKHTKC